MLKTPSTYSAVPIARERGVHKVCNDSRVIFTQSRKERTFMERKITPRRIKWTETSRAFFKKTHKTDAVKAEPVPITKIVRGFAHIPKSLLASTEEKKTEERKEAGVWKKGKLLRNANMNAGHRQ